MENYSTNYYLNNSFGHEFNENFVENFHQHEQHHQSKTQDEMFLQGTMFEYDGTAMSSNNQDVIAWNHHHDNQTSYLPFPNFFENPGASTPISDNMKLNGTNSLPQYPNESLEFIANAGNDLVNRVVYSSIDNIESERPKQTPLVNGKCPTYFSCENIGCNKTYASISGLNNHIKKKHSGTVLFPCDECNATFMTTQQRTVHKIKEHNDRKYQPSSSRHNDGVNGSDKNGKSIESHLYKCQSCDDAFNHKADLVRHSRNRHTGSGEYPCSKCSKVFFTYDMYNEHLSLHDESIPKHTCNDCGKEFISLRKLKEHSIIHKERIMFKCEMCSKIFVRSQTLQYHRITCKAAYQCTFCVDSVDNKKGRSLVGYISVEDRK